MLTRSNVAYNLHISPHREVIPYGENHHVEFVFSSDLYRRKFLEKQESNRMDIATSLYNRFGIAMNCNLLADLRTYKTIEKRGFLIYVDSLEVVCQDDLVLDGARLTMRNSVES